MEIIASQGAPPVSTTPAAKLLPVSTTPAANLPPVSVSVVDTGGKFATGVNDAVGKLQPVSTTPATNLPPVSTTQIMGTISGCSHLKLNLKAKIYIYVNSTTQRCPSKIIKILQFEDFCHLPQVSATPVVHLELQISPRIFEKIRNGPIGILRGLGETDS